MILSKYGPKLDQLVYEWSLFLASWYLYVSTFKFGSGTSLRKPNLSTPGVESGISKLIHYIATPALAAEDSDGLVALAELLDFAVEQPAVVAVIAAAECAA